MAVDTVLKSIWNMDEAVLKAIYFLKLKFVNHLKDWELDSAYWTLRNIRMEVDSKLKSEEQEMVADDLEKLEKERNEYLKNPKDSKQRGEFYLQLESYYILLNRLMKRHGLYFREGDDPRYAVLQR